MGNAKRVGDSGPTKKIRPALTPESEETQMIALALNLAKEQILNGTASSQVITHFLKLGTERARLEKEKLIKENKLLEVKASDIENRARSDELFEQAIEAMKRYSGNGDSDDY
jgi:hypothetical protein